MAESEHTPEYICLLCIEPYKDPKELPCYHTFCVSCLTSFIDKEHRTADADRHYFPCPICDTPTIPRDVNTDVTTWGNSFPTNSLFINRTKKTSDDQNCEACRRVGELNTAVVWCTVCNELLCKQCEISHERLKVTVKHRLAPITEEKYGETTVNENCPSHKGRMLELYCFDHSSLCCNTCVSVSHRACNDIKPIDDVTNKNIPKRPARETAWGNIKDEAKAMLEDDEAEMKLLNSQEKEVTVEMTRRVQQAKDKLDSLNITFQSEVARQCKQRRQQLTYRMEYVKKFHTNANNSDILMTRLHNNGTDRQRFVMREKTKQQLSGHYHRMDQNTKKEPNTFDLNLRIGTVIDEIMMTTTIGIVDVTSKISSTSQNANARIGTLLGTLMSSPSATTLADSTSASDLVGSLQHITYGTSSGATRVDVWNASLSCVASVKKSSLPGKRTPYLTGGIFTDNGELLVTDFNNGRLVLFDDTYCYKKEYIVKGNPSCVTRGHNTDEILVGIKDKSIIKYTLQNERLTEMETISCKGINFGMAVLGDQILVSTYDGVKVLSSDGRVKIPLKKKIGYFTSIVACTSKFYYSDGDGIVCRRLTSDVEDFRYSNFGLSKPTGLGLDCDNNVYCCGLNSGYVYIVSPDGLRVKTLLSRLCNITCPFGIIVHSSKQEIVVTSDKEKYAFEVYRFGGKNGVTQ